MPYPTGPYPTRSHTARPYIALTVLLAAGAAHASPQASPLLAPRGTMPTDRVAHIYYNVATGERIAVPLGDVRPADQGVSPAVWIADNALPCADFGQTGARVGVIDSPACMTCFDSTVTGQTFLDWGDIRTDTVVDCVGVTWSSFVQDTDTNGDGIGDGVRGFGATWTVFDADNGFDSSDTRRPITSFTLIDLPGRTGTFNQAFPSTYTATIDLAASFSSSLVFEIGDTDSLDNSGTGNFNPGAGADLDGDANADFSYAVRYHQPGTTDFDGDGVPDGDPDDQELTAWLLVTGNGDIDLDGNYVPETDVPGAIGIEDAFDIFIDVDEDGVLEPIGTFFYGGFECGGPTGNTAFAQFYFKLFGPSCLLARCTPPCPSDLFPPSGGDGVLNFFDLNQYLTLFHSADPAADIFPRSDPDGLINFFDLNQFLIEFSAGCP